LGIYRFGGTPKKFYGTLVRRGLPVEKHWNRATLEQQQHPASIRVLTR